MEEEDKQKRSNLKNVLAILETKRKSKRVLRQELSQHNNSVGVRMEETPPPPKRKLFKNLRLRKKAVEHDPIDVPDCVVVKTETNNKFTDFINFFKRKHNSFIFRNQTINVDTGEIAASNVSLSSEKIRQIDLNLPKYKERLNSTNSGVQSITSSCSSSDDEGEASKKQPTNVKINKRSPFTKQSRYSAEKSGSRRFIYFVPQTATKHSFKRKKKFFKVRVDNNKKVYPLEEYRRNSAKRKRKLQYTKEQLLEQTKDKINLKTIRHSITSQVGFIFFVCRFL